MVRTNFVGSSPLPHHPRTFFPSMDPVRPKGFPTVFERLKSVNAFSSFVSAIKSVGYRHTCASTGLVVNHCAVTMSPKGNAWNLTCYLQNFFLCRPPFWSKGPKYAPVAARQLQQGNADCVALMNEGLPVQPMVP